MDELRDLLAVANSLHMEITITIQTDGSGHIAYRHSGPREQFTAPGQIVYALAKMIDDFTSRRGLLDRILGRK